MTQSAASAHDGREETKLEQLARNTIELLNELRVASRCLIRAPDGPFDPAPVVGTVAAMGITGLWFALPLSRRAR